MKDTLILGFGSDILCDEGIVSRIIDNLKIKFPDAQYKQFLTLSLDVLEEISGYKTIIIIDTVVSGTSDPGTVAYFNIHNYQPTLHLENLHDISLPSLYKVAKYLGYSISDDINIMAIEIIDHTTICKELSPVIASLYTAILQNIHKKIDQKIRFIPVNEPIY